MQQRLLFRSSSLYRYSLSRNQSVLTIIPSRYGSSHAVVEQPPKPLREVARFTFDEVEKAYKLFKDTTQQTSSLDITKDKFSSFLEPLGIENTSKNVDEYFKIFSKNNDTVCLKEFISTTTTCVIENDEKLAEIQFQIWDDNNTGKLSEETYLKMLPYVNSTQLDAIQIRSAGKEIFHLLDKDNTGFISLNDYKRGIYISRRRFGSFVDSLENPKAKKVPLIKFSRWNSWDYLFLGTGMVASVLMFM